MKIDKVSEYILKDDNGNEVRIKHMDDSWHFVIDDDSVFSFAAEECNRMIGIFLEIRKHADNHILELNDMLDELGKD